MSNQLSNHHRFFPIWIRSRTLNTFFLLQIPRFILILMSSHIRSCTLFHYSDEEIPMLNLARTFPTPSFIFCFLHLPFVMSKYSSLFKTLICHSVVQHVLIFFIMFFISLDKQTKTNYKYRLIKTYPWIVIA